MSLLFAFSVGSIYFRILCHLGQTLFFFTTSVVCPTLCTLHIPCFMCQMFWVSLNYLSLFLVPQQCQYVLTLQMEMIIHLNHTRQYQNTACYIGAELSDLIDFSKLTCVKVWLLWWNVMLLPCNTGFSKLIKMFSSLWLQSSGPDQCVC